MTGSENFSLLQFLDGVFVSLIWCAIGFAAWWMMFQAPFGRRTFRASVAIKAPVERIWSAFLLEPSPPGGWGGALEISGQEFRGEPPSRHRVVVRHGGMGPFRDTVWRILRLEPFTLYEAEQETIGGKAVGAREAAVMRLRLTPRGGEALVEQETRRHVRGVFGFLYVPRANRRCFDHLRAHCEGLEAMNAAPIVSRSASFLLAILAFGAVVALFCAANPEIWEIVAFIAIFLQLALWTHEYGHLIAMRWFGQRDATLLMLPFLGGAALNTRRPRSRFEEAMIALMGPAFSGVIVLALTPFAPWGLRFFEAGTDPEALSWTAPGAPATWAGLCVVAFLAMSIPINLYNLTPIGALDGGRVVSALARGRLSRALLTAGVFAALAYAIAGTGSANDFGAAIAFVAVAAASALLAGANGHDELAPMSRGQTATTALLLAVTLFIHVDASRTLLPRFMAAVRDGVGGTADAGPPISATASRYVFSETTHPQGQTAAP
ncbi:SRPBCC family protein [Methylocystis sp. WRRC1]|uniref:SRPBCC family protein n=1 Tax=Methylocystis sp. WRRC1 TaxID=1732014 RepID=UPI001D14844B|nr:SRPBCC family protein [Methylocystis sp. WRRC1]